MSNTITVKKAKGAIQNMRKLTPANPKLDDDLEMTVKETVFLLAPDLIQMSKRGFTNKELSVGLAAEGINIKPGTLNRYLNEYLIAKGDAEKSESPETGTAESDKGEPGQGDTKPGASVAPRQSDTPGNGNEARQSDSPVKNSGPNTPGHQSGPLGRKVNEAHGNPKSGPENPKPAPKNPEPEEETAAEKSDSSPISTQAEVSHA